MFNPKSLSDLEALGRRSQDFSRELKTLITRRIRKCKNGQARQVEKTVQFLYARALAESLAGLVVTEDNEEFLRELVDLFGEGFHAGQASK